MEAVPIPEPVSNPIIVSDPNPIIISQDVIPCPICTFDNDPLLSNCEMCGSGLR